MKNIESNINQNSNTLSGNKNESDVDKSELNRRIDLLLEEKHLADERIRKLEIEIRDLINGINNERSKRQKHERQLKMEIKAIDLQLQKAQQKIKDLEGETTSLTENQKIDIEEEGEEVENLEEETEVLQHFDPKYWENIKAIYMDKPLTIPLLKALLEKKDIKMIILAMMLMSDHNACLEILKELEELGIVGIEFQKEGDLNPRIQLIDYLG